MTWSGLWLRAGGQVFYEFAPNHMYFQQEQGVREIEPKKTPATCGIRDFKIQRRSRQRERQKKQQ